MGRKAIAGPEQTGREKEKRKQRTEEEIKTGLKLSDEKEERKGDKRCLGCSPGLVWPSAEEGLEIGRERRGTERRKKTNEG